MFVRTSTWKGDTEALGRWADRAVTHVKPMVENLAGNKGTYFLVDRVSGAAMTITLWESEEAALASDEAAERSRSSTLDATGIELVARGRYEVVAAS